MDRNREHERENYHELTERAHEDDEAATATGYVICGLRDWQIETAFQNAKSHFGFEDPQNRTERTAPMGMVFYSLDHRYPL